MPTFKLPLSGDVVQSISPWTAFMSPIGSQLGLINVTIGQSSEPAVEADALSDVASYGKQLGRIGDALIVLLAHFHPATSLSPEETAAIDDLKEMLARIADVKDKHKRKAPRPQTHHAPHHTPSPPDMIMPPPADALPPVDAPPTLQAPPPSEVSGDPAPQAASRRSPRSPARRPA